MGLLCDSLVFNLGKCGNEQVQSLQLKITFSVF